MVVAQRGDDPARVIEAFRYGQESALSEVYARWSPLVHTVALRSLDNLDDAEDVTQRVFTQAWASREAFDPVRLPLPAWLVEITRQVITDKCTAAREQARPRTRNGRVRQVDDKTEPAALVERLLLADELSRLDATAQQVLRMALYDNVPHGQIAERTGLSPSIVKSHILRSLRTLRRSLQVPSDAY